MSPALASVTSPVPRANTAGLLSQYRAAAAGAGPSDIPVVPPNVQRRIAAEAHGLKPTRGSTAASPASPSRRRAAGRASAAAAEAEPPAISSRSLSSTWRRRWRRRRSRPRAITEAEELRKLVT